MTAEHMFIVEIRWKERVETDAPGTTTMETRKFQERVMATEYWKVYRELLDRGLIPERTHEVEIVRVGGDD